MNVKHNFITHDKIVMKPFILQSAVKLQQTEDSWKAFSVQGSLDLAYRFVLYNLGYCSQVSI